MEAALNNIQLEILKLFSTDQSEEDLKKLKSLLITYLSDKVVREADKAAEIHNYTRDIFERWKEEHFRKSA
ncbi:hypothetical protein A8C56_22485 [Niabella ginsenosidivorans]|uniref:Uncharacterized protein n=1 Tax=Niabella ginsenosidivorans TaxID=1176587 RepID=A0A1A9I9J4_9BACT|nr:hypothetical protein [Niabella ginsenosidivorans]ANH83382.1 hypothetical protein A8C56_22485 [Niabella ginsenosidivorans]